MYKTQLYVLYEHAAGFTLCRTSEFEEIAVFLPEVKKSIKDISKFRSNVFFVAFQPFTEQKNALHNMKCTVAGELSKDLQLFLENNVPRTKKSKQSIVLGVEDPVLAAFISDKLGIKCVSSDVVIEIIRGIRLHFHKLVKGFKDEDSAFRAQLALSHNFCRDKLQFDVARQDCMIIEIKSFIDELEKNINNLGKRIRGLYAFHFPELTKIIHDNTKLYVQCVNLIGDRKNMPEDIEEKLNALLGDSYNVKSILTTAQNSMGAKIFSVDLENLKMLCERGISLINTQQSSIQHLSNKMNVIAPAISSLVGEMAGARLIVRAGSLLKLAKLPASTLQVLGADKKIFRSVKRKKGILPRILANKCSLAARVDCFRKTEKEGYGEKLKEDVEHCLKYAKKAKCQ